MLFESISDQVVLYRDESDHTHDTIQEKSSRISNEVKETIKELWANGYKWVKSNKTIFSIELDNSIEYYIPVGQETKITNFDIEVMNKLKWYSFDQYKKIIQYLVCHITNR